MKLDYCYGCTYLKEGYIPRCRLKDMAIRNMNQCLVDEKQKPENK